MGMFYIQIKRIRDFLSQLDKPNGLYPLYLNPKTGKWSSCEVFIPFYSSVAFIYALFEGRLFFTRSYLFAIALDFDIPRSINITIRRAEAFLLKAKRVTTWLYYPSLSQR